MFNSLMQRGLFGIVFAIPMLCAFAIVVAGQGSGTTSSGSQKSAAKTLTAKQRAAQRSELYKVKQVRKWPRNSVFNKNPGTVAIPLTPKECGNLGGKVAYHTGCDGTNLKCSVGGYSVCIDELDPKPPPPPPTP